LSISADEHKPHVPLEYYLEDTTHSNPGYSSGYTNALIYRYGFPEESTAISELESEYVFEAESRAQGVVAEYDARMTG
jgi:hypothetical protein